MSEVFDPQEVVRRSREIREAKLAEEDAIILALATAGHEHERVVQSVAEAKAEHEKAWKAAVDAGFSEKDLRTYGGKSPEDVAKLLERKPRASRRPTKAVDLAYEQN